VSDRTWLNTLDTLRELNTAFQLIRGSVITFSERKQEFFCTICRYRDPLVDGTKLHDDDCMILAASSALEQLLLDVQGHCGKGEL